MSKTCKKCGQLNKDSDTRCSSCGARLGSSFDEKMISLFYPFFHGDETVLSFSILSLLGIIVLPILFYGILFITVFIDKSFLGYNIPNIGFFILMGVIYGISTLIINLVIAWIIHLINKKKIYVSKTLAYFSFGFTIPLFMAVLGLVFRLLFGWSIIVFGLLGLLLTIVPLWNYLNMKIKNRLIVAAVSLVYGFILCLLTNIILCIGTI